ncbi:phosphohydrolase [Paenibacillus sp. PK3_47]|uniref:pyridoxamine 5'-phosphate oxidase family protein n=1 Tax=Paenibacillus sp. PK3_47 TaxID=2072642 RepID=UPI00201DEF2C|nr:pyridoxamine 5'-phosphate oxidase family protein [Paenibacillus sp. PK3_47]UQZ36705.1 phosphohydrolase [Paenibacillus sp. PK3_47]
MGVIEEKFIIRTEDGLRSLMGYPKEIAEKKMITTLDENCKEFIAKSPFMLLSTSNASGQCDVSPRGDHPGFVHIIDEQHLLIPERPGNKRYDSLRNIIGNPEAGLLFLIPGLGETLRINGRAYITTDPKLLAPAAVRDSVPVMGIIVEAVECFLHCAKAFRRSQLWEPGSWLDTADLPSAARMLSEHIRMEGLTPEAVALSLEDGYKNRLY